MYFETTSDRPKNVYYYLFIHYKQFCDLSNCFKDQKTLQVLLVAKLVIMPIGSNVLALKAVPKVYADTNYLFDKAVN